MLKLISGIDDKLKGLPGEFLSFILISIGILNILAGIFFDDTIKLALLLWELLP